MPFFAIPFPMIDPVLVAIGPFAIRWYALAYIVGFETECRFARAVLAHSADADELRAEIVRRFGPRAVLALAFGIMAAQLYPTLKYALGHGKACTRVVVAGQAIPPRRAAAGAA